MANLGIYFLISIARRNAVCRRMTVGIDVGQKHLPRFEILPGQIAGKKS